MCRRRWHGAVRLPAAQHGQHLQAGGQSIFAQQPGGTLLLCFSVVIHDLLVEHFCRAVRDILRNGGKGFFGLPQKGIAAVGYCICLTGGVNRVPRPARIRLTSESRSSKGACSSRANTAGFACPAKISSTP